MDASELAFAGITRQAQLIAAQEVSSRELTELYLERIARLNPQLNAFRAVRGEHALLEADQADARVRAGDQRPLLGVPFAVKDNIDVAGEVTASGTRAYGEPAPHDAEVVRRLRETGAVILGKTHTPELCIWPFTESATYGLTRSPWSLEHSPGGSSGGSGAAVAAGLVGAALASDGGGSIRVPAAWCGLLGLKPGRGRVPLAPHDRADWHGLSVFGVLTRSVADTALFHDVMNEARPDSATPSGLASVNFGEAAAAEPRRLRIAVATNVSPGAPSKLHPDNRAALTETTALLSSLGHTCEQVRIDYGGMLAFAVFFARFIRGVADEAGAVAHPERLERRTRAMARAGRAFPPALFHRLQAREGDAAEHLNRVLGDHDVLLTPTTPAPPLPVGRFEGRGWVKTALGAGGVVPYLNVWNGVGQPACSVPAGLSAAGLPRAVQLVAPLGGEATLLTLAAELERARPWAQERPALA